MSYRENKTKKERTGREGRSLKSKRPGNGKNRKSGDRKEKGG